MADSYFVRPDVGGPALEIKPGVSGHVLITTAPGASVPHVVLRPRHVEEACRAMYRMAGLDWPGEETTPVVDGNMPGRNYKGMLYTEVVDDLIKRIESLEQGAASGAATDDMFAEQARRIESLEQDTRLREDHMRLHESLTRRLESLEQTYVDDTGTSDIIVQLLTEIRDRLPTPPPPACGEPNGYGAACSQPAGHSDRHRAGITTWPNFGPQCEELWPHDGVTRCRERAGHPENHSTGRGIEWSQ